MEQITYLDFDMLIESVEGGYSVRVLSSPAGEASSRFILPFSELELDNIALQLGRTRRGVRRLESPEMEVARNFGRRLFEAVFTQGVRDRLHGSLGSVNRQGQGLRIRLRMAGAPELSNLPWEYLYDPSFDRFLVLSVQTPLVRYLEIPQPVRPLSIKPPLNVVLMISNPEDYSRLDVEREWEKLKEALGSLEQRGLVSLHRLDGASLDSLLRKIRTGEYHIFHFIGHGGFDRQAEDGVLVMEDEHRRSRLVSGRYLGTILHDHRSMRLAILNACEGARTSRNDPFAGVAQSLVQQGIPAVIAMQFEITDEAAITFSHELYGAMADGYPIDAALAEARKAIFAQDNDVEWGTPVLYLCSPNGLIFDVAPAERDFPRLEVRDSPSDREIDLRIEQLYTEGLSAYWLEEWEKATRSFRSILELRPDHPEASTRISEAERQLKLHGLYERARAAESEADWRGAQNALEELAEVAPSYRDVPTWIETVRRQSQLSELYGEARQLHQAGKWQAVISVFAKIDAIDSQFPDPENLRATAEEKTAEQRRQEELETLYTHAVRELDAEHWEASRQLFAEVQEKEPGYRQVERLLQRVEAELSRQAADRQRQEQLARMYEEARNLAKANQWRLVHESMEEINQLEPGFTDPEGLAAKARQELEEENRKVDQAKKLATLYSEAVQLVEAGKYQEALARWGEVQALDGNYPDRQKVYATATRRLKEVAKPPVSELQGQEQIASMYEEARYLAKAKQWWQVPNRMEEIYRLDPGFIDPEGLATRAKNEIEKETRKAELDKKLVSLYSEAVQLLKAGEYQVALAKWNEVHTLDAGFPDRQKVYERATRRLGEVAKPPKTAVGQETLSWQKKEWATVWIGYSWFITSSILVALVGANQSDLLDPSHSQFWILDTILGLLLGAGLITGLRVGGISLKGQHLILLMVVWGLPVYSLEGINPNIGSILFGFLRGSVLGLVIYWATQILPMKRVLIIAAGWAGSYLLSQFIIDAFLSWNYIIAVGLGVGFAGLVGSWITLEAIREEPIARRGWLLVRVSALGFTIGMLLANGILLLKPPLIPILVALSLWGFFAGGGLGFPSKNINRRIALLSGTGAAGMLIGLLIWKGIVPGDTITNHLDDLLTHFDIMPCLGLGLGLALGFSTRRISAALILALAGAGLFLLYSWIIYETNGYLLGAILTGPILGGALGLAWGTLQNRDQESSS